MTVRTTIPSPVDFRDLRDTMNAVRVNALMASAKMANPVTLPALTSGPTFTSNGATAVAGLTQFLSPASAVAFEYFGGPYDTSLNVVRSTSAPIASGANYRSWTNRVRFRAYSAKLAIAVYGATSGLSNGFRLLVNGQFVSKAVLVPTANLAVNYLVVDWTGTDTTPRMRTYELEWFALSGGQFRGVYLDPLDTWQTPERAKYRIGVVGDSIPTGVKPSTTLGNSQLRQDGWTNQAGYLLGSTDIDIVQMTLPGTGYLTSASYYPIGSHLDDLLRQPIDEIWDGGAGVNDSAADQSAYQAAILDVFRGMRSRCPNARIVVGGVFTNGSQGKAGNLLREALKKVAFDQWADSNSAWIAMQTASSPPETTFSDQAGNAARIQDPTETGGPLHLVTDGDTFFAQWWAEQRRGIAL